MSLKHVKFNGGAYNWRILLLAVGLALVVHASFGQSPSATIATWKDNYTAAYSIIHDDFGSGSVNGIENYADTIAYNRGVKFTFGAITSVCDAGDWINAARLMSHGHEIMNHSHNHYCGQPVGWCETATWNENDFPTEIDLSSTLIETNTGHYPRFFIFPYDLHTDTMLSYLESIDYLGARAGIQSQGLDLANLNQPNFPDPFRVNFFVFGTATAVSELNGAVDMAIANDGWAMRELHGVQDASWASVPETDYRAHCDYVQTRANAGDVWPATTSEVISYQTQRMAYTPVVTTDLPTSTITINWNNSNPDLKTNLLVCPITLNIDFDGMAGNFVVYQDGNPIDTITSLGGVHSINVYPHEGVVTLSSPCAGGNICIIQHPTDRTLIEGQTAQFVGVAYSSVKPLTYQWQKDGVDIPGATDSVLTIPNVVVADAGSYQLAISNGVTTEVTDPAVLTISTQSPYGGTLHTIPGMIEIEAYDLGGQGLAYNDDSPGNAGGVFRTDDVDLEITTDAGGGYNLSNFNAGEWLEFSVDVTETAMYTFEIRVAAQNAGSSIFIEMDGANISGGNVAVPQTGGWQTWQTMIISNVSLTQGIKLMRVGTTTGSFNINYVNVIRLPDDCNGVSGGSAYLDNCGICVGGTTGEMPCTQDCNGDWGGTAYTDSCGVCVAGNTGLTACIQEPYNGTPHSIEGVIQAEEYDLGGLQAYNDDTPGNSGGSFRTDPVDIEGTTDVGGGYNVGWITPGEWLEYTVDVTQHGRYDLEFRVATPTAGTSLSLLFDGVDMTGSVSIPVTGGWQTWTTVTVSDVTLTSGIKIMRLATATGDFNLNYIEATLVEALPVSLLNFTGERSGDDVLLTWSTATESDNEYFIIERSIDGVSFEEIAIINGNGNSTALLTYTYTDHEAMNRMLYYRLKQVDYSGDITQIGTIVVGASYDAELVVKPNPFSVYATIMMKSNTAVAGRYMIRDVNGRMVESGTYTSNNAFAVGKDLKNGVYLIEIYFEDKRYTEKIIKVGY